MKWGIASRFALFISLVALVATGTVGFMVYRGAQASLMNGAAEQLAHTADVIKVRIAGNVETIVKDVQFLAATPPVQGIVRARLTRGLDPRTSIWDQEWGEQLAAIFKYFIESRPSYLQARLIGQANDGRELVRVIKEYGRARFATPDELQVRGDDVFFQAAARLDSGAVFFSQIEPSEEPGLPSGIPVLHAATPIFTEAGDFFGVLEVSVDGRQMLGSLNNLVGPTQSLYLANGAGELLFAFGPRLDTGESAAPPARLEEVFAEAEALQAGRADEMRLLDARLASGTRGLAYLGRLPLGAGSSASHVLVGVTEPHSSILADVRRVRNQSIVITLLLGLAAVALSLTVSSYLTQPLRQITRAVSTFGRGDEAIPLPVDRSDEIGMLARSFDAMAWQIQHQINELEEEELRQRIILETSAEGIVVTNSEGLIEAFNPAAETIFGLDAAAAAGRSIATLLEGPVSGDGSGAWTRLLQVDEATGCRDDGSRVPLAITWSQFELGGARKYTIFIQDVTERKDAEAARERLVRELEKERESLQRLSETLEEHVRQRTADLVRTNADLERSNRELRDFANVASHDLQEPLRKLQSFADLLASEYGGQLEGNGHLYIERIAHAAGRMSQLITDLLAFSHVSASARVYRVVDLQRIARETVEDLEIHIQETEAEVAVDELPTIEADPAQMRQLFQNLITNALKFRRPGVPPRIRVHAEYAREPDGAADDVVRIHVEDNGIGFDEKYIDRIFSPFQRLHDRESYEGTGMGLTICRRIVEHHDGSIAAHSVPGRGTTFVISLPRRQTHPAHPEEGRPA